VEEAPAEEEPVVEDAAEESAEEAAPPTEWGDGTDPWATE
jgi:hypothetical protein